MAPGNGNADYQFVFLNDVSYVQHQKVSLVVGGTDATSYVMLVLRSDDALYQQGLFFLASNGYVVLRKRIAGVTTDIGDAFPALAATDVLSMEVNGTQVTVLKNGSNISGSPFTVATLPTGDRCGAGFYGADTTEAARVTSFTVTNYGV